MHVSLVTAVLLACSACTPSLRILSPTEGAMLDAGEDVAVLAEASRGSVRVNGEGADKLGAGLWTATVPGVDGGLGFAWAEVEGKDAIAVRSWHQGSFGVAGSWQEGAMQLVLGSEALCTGDPSVCAWVGELLEGQDLSGFVDNPLNVSGVEITVESAVAAGVDVSVESSEVLFVTIQLQDLVAEYTADAWLYTSSGTATFAQVDIVGSLFFEGADASLEPGDVQASEAVVEDDGALPSTIVDLLAAALQGEMEEAMAGAAVAATEQVVGELLAQAGPMPALTFDHPVSAEARASTASGSTAGLALTYDVLVFAETSAVASEEQGYLQGREEGVEPGSSALTLAVGAPLVDALAFAAWDAGNLEGLVFTREELETAGMPSLEFPYDHFEEAELRLALPPLLAWRSDGPWLDVGGVVAELSVRTSKDATAWTAAHVPVLLEEGDGGLYLRPDPDRAVEMESLGFEDLNELADHEQVSALVESAVPEVLDRVFGQLPAVSLPELAFTALDGSDGPIVHLTVESLDVSEGRWLLGLAWIPGE